MRSTMAPTRRSRRTAASAVRTTTTRTAPASSSARRHAIGEHAQGGGALPDRCPHRAADQPADASDAEHDRAGAGAIAEHLVDRAGRHLPRDADRRPRRRHQLRPVRDHQGRGVQRDARVVRVSARRLGCVQLAGAVIWRYAQTESLHASVSDRARFPVIFELYSTRFGTATPNPDLGPERATNLEVGWKTSRFGRVRLEGAVFYSDVRASDSDGRAAGHDDADAERRRRRASTARRSRSTRRSRTA